MKTKFTNIKSIVLGLFMIIGSTISAQTGGSIKGKVFKLDSTSAAPMATVKVLVNGEVIGAKTDFNGNFKIDAIQPGVYTMTVESALDGKTKIFGIEVSSDQITEVDAFLTDGILGDIVPVYWKKKKIDINNVTKISLTELKHNINIQNPKQMLVTKSSEISMNQDNQLIIRGSRPGDVIYYVDGVKQTNIQNIPGVAIGGVTVYTGGVPAKYGDTTGGVVILETKGYFDLYYAWLASQ